MTKEAKRKSNAGPYTLQHLAKEILNYTPTFHGITFDGRNVYGNQKVTPAKALKFLRKVEEYYEFTPMQKMVIEELIYDDDTYVYFTKYSTGDGFELHTD